MSVVGVILAGGNSTRMGQDKAKMLWQGKTWLAHTQDTLYEAGVEKVIVSSSNAVPNSYITIADIHPNNGPLGGIHAAIKTYMQPLLFVAVDMPTLSGSQLSQLIDCKHNADVVIYESSPLPFLIKPTQAHLKLLEDILSSTTSSKAIRRFFDELCVESLISKIPLQNFNYLSDIVDKYW